MELTGTPLVTGVRVVPVAGHDSMLLNLSGAHGPFFTRNLVIVEDASGHVGVGEVPGGEAIRRTLTDAAALVIGEPFTVPADADEAVLEGQRLRLETALAAAEARCHEILGRR